jgi:hypothetical protein
LEPLAVLMPQKRAKMYKLLVGKLLQHPRVNVWMWLVFGIRLLSSMAPKIVPSKRREERREKGRDGIEKEKRSLGPLFIFHFLLHTSFLFSFCAQLPHKHKKGNI